MAVELSAYTTEDGPLLNWKALWPHLTKPKVVKQFTAWLEEAVAKVEDFEEATQDDAVRVLMRVRAWDDVFQIRVANPATVEISGKGGSGYTVTQIQMALDERDRAQAEFDAIEAAQPAEDVGVPATPRSSASVPIRFVW